MSKPEKTRRGSALSGARGVATIVLHRVATDAAFAMRALDAEISAAGLDARDARLATEIVYGTLRMLPTIDARLDQQLTRGRPDPFTFAALRAATYQALALSRVPSFAIVQETVAIVKHKRGEGLGKLTNAVLRRIVAERPDAPAAPSQASVPEWVAGALSAGLGETRAAQYLAHSPLPPPSALRICAGRERAAVLAQLRAAAPNAQLEESTLLGDVILARGLGDVRKLPGYAEGHFALQDQGAALVGLLAGARPGERVLDACAGRGGKTVQLLEAVGPRGEVTAVDLHARKLEQLGDELARLGYPRERVRTEAVDLSVGDGGLARDFDRVLVDAPCTGLGTLRRRPDILLRLTPADPARMAALQVRILATAASLLRPGGILVFAVCSATREEGPEVAAALESRVPNLERLIEPLPEVSVACDGDGVFRIGPWLADGGAFPDVYQVVRWRCLTAT